MPQLPIIRRVIQTCRVVNPLKPSVTIWLHMECLAPYSPNLPLLISDIRALWRSVLSGRFGLYGEVEQFKELGFKGLNEHFSLKYLQNIVCFLLSVCGTLYTENG